MSHKIVPKVEVCYFFVPIRGPEPPSTTSLLIICALHLCPRYRCVKFPRVWLMFPWTLFLHVLPCSAFNFGVLHNFKILPDQYPGQKIYYPKEKTWNLHPWFWKKDVSYPHSNVLKAELFIFNCLYAILALIHISMAYII